MRYRLIRAHLNGDHLDTLRLLDSDADRAAADGHPLADDNGVGRDWIEVTDARGTLYDDKGIRLGCLADVGPWAVFNDEGCLIDGYRNADTAAREALAYRDAPEDGEDHDPGAYAAPICGDHDDPPQPAHTCPECAHADEQAEQDAARTAADSADVDHYAQSCEATQ